jgi:hypothetical protein
MGGEGKAAILTLLYWSPRQPAALKQAAWCSAPQATGSIKLRRYFNRIRAQNSALPAAI